MVAARRRGVLLEGFKADLPALRCLTADMAEGSFIRPDLSYDGQKVLFAYCQVLPAGPRDADKANKANLPEEAFYHVFEMNLDGSGRRQLTHGRYDDFDARYLPSGDIVFLSTRKGRFLQCSEANTRPRPAADLPDSYVRCGGDNYRPVPVFTLHVMDAEGGDLRPISAFENFEWTPSVANDGRILYTPLGLHRSLQRPFLQPLVHQSRRHQPATGLRQLHRAAAGEVRGPADPRLAEAGLHGRGAPLHRRRLAGASGPQPRHGGGDRRSSRLTPEVPFPETEGNVDMLLCQPLSAFRGALPGGLGRPPAAAALPRGRQRAEPGQRHGAVPLRRLRQPEPALSRPGDFQRIPIPVGPRPKPPALPERRRLGRPAEGCFLVQDVYQGLAGVPRGTVEAAADRGRAAQGPAEHEPAQPGRLGRRPRQVRAGHGARGSRRLGLFPRAQRRAGLLPGPGRARAGRADHAEPDLRAGGSRRSPASAATNRETRRRGQRFPLRAARARRRSSLPAPKAPGRCATTGSCSPCSTNTAFPATSQKSDKPRASKLDLTAAKSYDSLLNFGNKDLHKLAFERDRSMVGEMPARKSKLYALLIAEKGHEGVRLDADSLQRLVTWMDTYACRQGYFSAKQEGELTEFRKKLEGMLEK